MNESVTRNRIVGNGAHAAPDASSRASPGPTPLRYLAALAAGALGACVLFYVLLFGLRASGNLPPPAFTNSLCIDEKLNFMRENPVPSPGLLVVGSSVAWRHFDGSAIADLPQTRPLNGGFCGIHVNQSVYVTNWLLDRNPSVRHVVMITSPQDFGECSMKRTEVFDLADVDAFVYEGASAWPYYLRYFAPGSLFGNARKIKVRRAGVQGEDPLAFDRFGGGPLDTTWSRPTLYYGAPEPLDQTCFDALGTLATRLHREGRPFTVVSTPLHPDWKAKEDPDGSFIRQMNAAIASALKPGDGRYWDADAEWKTQRSSYTDAIHLRWSAARTFSVALAQELQMSRPRPDVQADVPTAPQQR